MKTHEKKTPSFFRWIRTARDRINRETEGMTPEEWVAYTNTRFLEARKSVLKFTPEEAERVVNATLYREDEPTPSRRATASRKPASPLRRAAVAKTSTPRRKVAKRLAHA